MRRIAVILLLTAAGAAFGQSGVYNVPYNPQPRIRIPNLEAPAFSGVETVTNYLNYTNSYVERVDKDTFLKTLSKSFVTITNVVDGVTNTVQVLSDVSYTTGTVVTNLVTDISFDAASYSDTRPIENPTGTLRYTDFVLKAVSQDTSLYVTDNSPIVWVYSSAQALTNLVEAVSDDDVSVFYQDLSRSWPGQTQRILYDRTGGSIQAASDNHGCAVEVWPHITPAIAHWLKPGEKRVKWMCLLSNGLDFYNDPDSGKPVWFEVDVEWVGRGAPSAGEWYDIL